MRILTSFALLLPFAVSACARQAPAPVAPADRPSLVVWITVDQLRADMLDHYRSLWKGGMRRLLDEGRYFTNASHDHARTVTATGHASLSTGVHPSKHGIVGNAWYERTATGWVPVLNVGDSTVRILGAAALPGVSPRPLMHSGLADWMVTADPASIIASVSAKDRGAILPAAHVKGHVYWLEPAGGGFVTSTYYRETYPAWVERFNREALAPFLADTVWTFTAPSSSIFLSSPDTAAHESDSVHTFFPHRIPPAPVRDRASLVAWLERTPLADAATIAFAQWMVRELALGRDASVDLLSVSLSSADAVGHEFGPFSREQLDNLHRLDRELGAFFEFLDATVGRGRWLAAVSADHGVITPPEDPRALAGSRRLTADERTQMNQLVVDALAAPAGVDAAARLVAAMKRLPVVADAWTEADLLRRTPADSFAVLMRRSLYPGRAGSSSARAGVEIRLAPGVLPNELTGTTHGSPYWYDRHVPMIFMGRGIPAGRIASRVSTVDFAPTIAALLGVRPPRGVDGRVLPLTSP
jgi:predicted AlkP superfamily pyrophosphatase or phosphodiesterase